MGFSLEKCVVKSLSPAGPESVPGSHEGPTFYLWNCSRLPFLSSHSPALLGGLPRLSFILRKIPCIWKLDISLAQVSPSSGGLSNTTPPASVPQFWWPCHWTQSLPRLSPDSACQSALVFLQNPEPSLYCINETMPFMFNFQFRSHRIIASWSLYECLGFLHY